MSSGKNAELYEISSVSDTSRQDDISVTDSDINRGQDDLVSVTSDLLSIADSKDDLLSVAESRDDVFSMGESKAEEDIFSVDESAKEDDKSSVLDSGGKELSPPCRHFLLDHVIHPQSHDLSKFFD